MKQILLSLLMFLFPVILTADRKVPYTDNPSLLTQMRKSAKKTSSKAKQSAAKGKSSKSSSKTIKAAPANGGMFEGSLLYRSEEYHSNIVRRFSYGRAYNGSRTTIVTVKGKAIHILDETMHLHTIVNLEDNTVYLYSDLTNTGLKGNTKDFEGFINTYDPNYQIGDQQKVSTLRMTNEKATFDNQKFGVYKGDVTIDEENRLDVEMWIWDKYKVSNAYNYLLFGIPCPGIVRKGIYSQVGSVPLLGKMKSMVAMELVAYSKYSVKTSEMLPPKSVSIENYTDVRQLARMYKDNRKQLKKHKLNPESKSKKESMRNISERWDFADEWLKKPVSTANNAVAWQTLGNSFLEIANTLAATNAQQAPDYSPNAVSFDDSMSGYDDEDDSKVDSKAKREKAQKARERQKENKKKMKQEGFAVRNMRSSSNNYNSYVDMINRIKYGYDYRGESFETKKRHVKDYQEQMKQIRERYEKGSGSKMPGSNEQLERWNPSRSDLMEKCSGCGGDGKCGSCSRRGNGRCSSCDGTGDISKTNKPVGCPNCQYPGNGKCKSCDGSGKCQKCNGKGEF
jgi:hypothetical protein